MVPFGSMLVLWVLLDRAPFFIGQEGDTPRWKLWNGRTVAAVDVCLLLSSAGVYYAAFTCFFLLVAGLAAALQRKQGYPLYSALLMVVLIGGGLLVNLTPNLAYRWQHGYNEQAVERRAEDAEK